MLEKLKPKSEFTKNVLTLMTGTTIAQAIPIAISPILTRIYTPEDYGFVALLMSVTSIVAVFATGKYELAIMLPKKDQDAINIVILSILISFIIFVVTFIIIFLFDDKIALMLSHPEISNWLYLIPFSVLLTGIYQSLNYWNNRKKQFKRLATNRVLAAASGSGSNLSFGLFGFGSSGIIIAGLISQIVSTSVLIKYMLKETSINFSIIQKIKLFAFMKKYKKLPLITLPNALIDSFRLSGIRILIAQYFTTAALGQFSLGWRMVQVPMTLIGGSLSQVFFQKVSSIDNVELYRIVKMFIIKAILIAAPMFLILYFFSVDIFEFVFGENWTLAGKVTSVLSLWLFFNFISGPLSTLYIVLNKQGLMLIFSSIYATVPLAIIMILHNNDFIYVLSIVTYSMSCLLFFLILMTLYITKKLSIKNK